MRRGWGEEEEIIIWGKWKDAGLIDINRRGIID